MATIEDRGKTERLRWKVRFRTPAGVQRSRAFAKKAVAERFADQVETDKVRGQFADPARGRLRFEEWVERWKKAPSTTRASTSSTPPSTTRTW